VLADDPDIRVRFQLACILGAEEPGVLVETLAQIVKHDPKDKWIRAAVLSAASTCAGELCLALADHGEFLDEGDDFLAQLGFIAGVRNRPNEFRPVFELLLSSPLQKRAMVQRTLLTQLADGLTRNGASVQRVINQLPSPVAEGINAIFGSAEQIALDHRQREAQRESAFRLLSFMPADSACRTLAKVLSPSESRALQIAAVRALGIRTEPAVADALVAAWAGLGPDARSEMLDVLLRRPEWVDRLLAALEKGGLRPGELDLSRRAQLLRSSNGSVREKASRLLGGPPSPDRQKVIEHYRLALQHLAGDRQRGSEVFDRVCATCHRHSPKENVGPRLGGLADRTPDTLLVQILDPNREVKPNFVSYLLVTKAGTEFSGIIVNESASSITIRRPGGEEDNVLRGNIQSLTSSTLSLMPDGLEAAISESQMADLIQFLQTYQD
jgi:putative heme-binding domain-containing protein